MGREESMEPEERRAVYPRVQRTPREWRASHRYGLLHSLLVRSSDRVYMSCIVGNMTIVSRNLRLISILSNNQKSSKE